MYACVYVCIYIVIYNHSKFHFAATPDLFYTRMAHNAFAQRYLDSLSNQVPRAQGLAGSNLEACREAWRPVGRAGDWGVEGGKGWENSFLFFFRRPDVFLPPPRPPAEYCGPPGLVPRAAGHLRSFASELMVTW